MKRQKLIDLESTQGMEWFKQQAGKTHARKRMTGLGERSDAQLLKSLSDRMLMEDNQIEASLLRRYAGKRVPALAWKYAASGVPAVLERLAKSGDDWAQELVSRLRGKRGLFDPKAEADYYALHAQECVQDAAEYAALGNTDAERLAKEVAAICGRLTDVLRGEGDLRPRKQAKEDDPRWTRLRRKLEQYERETAGMVRNTPAERAVAKRLAAQQRPKQTLHNYDRAVTRAIESRAKRMAAPA